MRSAWVMKLKAGQEAEYKRKHDEIWPEMVALLKSQGVYNYSIYRHGLLLFAYLEKPEDAPSQTGGVDLVIQKWWKWMEPHMETHPDARPVVEPVEEVFRLD
ncbi:L-rhamnose mutarotase [Devosia rhodophyticola]|uniref:L-rhamnose mutarotase n=1 Tax=Devosia rhodophyticola TaxID=3026423 RepID=A0ABY7YZT0_9HYPH|nr:L-rhamnose mutarotase [Devosia rhodophyticola]